MGVHAFHILFFIFSNVEDIWLVKRKYLQNASHSITKEIVSKKKKKKSACGYNPNLEKVKRKQRASDSAKLLVLPQFFLFLGIDCRTQHWASCRPQQWELGHLWHVW